MVPLQGLHWKLKVVKVDIFFFYPFENFKHGFGRIIRLKVLQLQNWIESQKNVREGMIARPLAGAGLSDVCQVQGMQVQALPITERGICLAKMFSALTRPVMHHTVCF